MKGWGRARVVNYFNCITTAGMKQLAIAMYGPAWAGVTLYITSQWRHTVANLKQISDWTDSQLNQELTAQCLSNQPAHYG